MLQERKILSVTIPTWNRAALLDELIGKLVAQITRYSLGHKIELYISNNGSTDETESVVRKYADPNSFITYNNNGTNIGARANVLKCLDCASGKYIILIGDDDSLRDNCLNELVSILEKRSPLLLIDNSKSRNAQQNGFTDLAITKLIEDYYWYIGNAGLFVVNTDQINPVIKSRPYDAFNECWPQTQVMILAAMSNPSEKITVAPLNLTGEAAHEDVMIYSSFYLWNAGYFALIRAAEEIRSETGDDIYYAGRNHLKKNMLQWIRNIAQCGIYVDDQVQRRKTISHIFKNMHYLQLKEKIAFTVLCMGLFVPSGIMKFLTDCCIFILAGKAALEKKNVFVKRELRKKNQSGKQNKVVRTFEFND